MQIKIPFTSLVNIISEVYILS
uniref:Uncharacterized protein n=1 Tax=Arundo donax TaxID=35708 RepID=A0A0A9BJ32_ARUDO